VHHLIDVFLGEGTGPAFAGAFLGATTIQPGGFNAWGSFAAVYFLVTGVDGLSLPGIQVFVQDLFYGAALIVAVSLSLLARRRASAS
jgi:ribose transport system permease protein